MAIVKAKPKKEPKPTFQYNFRTDIELHDRIESTFNACLKIQNIKKAELIRDAIERGLDAIEFDLMNKAKQ